MATGQTYLNYFQVEQFPNGYMDNATILNDAVIASREWMDSNNGGMLFVVNHDVYAMNGTGPAQLSEALGGGYTFMNADDTGYANITASDKFTGSKLYRFFVSKPYYLSPGVVEGYSFSNDSDYPNGYYHDHTYIATTLGGMPNSTIPLLVDYQNTNEVLLTLDPERRTIFLANPYIMYNGWINLNPNLETFAFALRIFASKTAQYGTSFSDMFIDDVNNPKYVPAPWDPHWGENALDLRDNNRNGRWSIRSAVDED